MPRSLVAALHAIKTCSSSLHEVADWIPYMSIPYRKFLMDILQSNLSIPESNLLQESYASILRNNLVPTRPDGTTFHSGRLQIAIQEIRRSTIQRSFISMLLRCESSVVDDLSAVELEKGLQKEIQASQTRRDVGGVRYGSIFGEFVPLTVHLPITPAWIQTSRRFCDGLTFRLGHLPPIFPKVQRKKNCSYETQSMLVQRNYSSERRAGSFSTLDLELFKVQTGEEVRGCCEMRWAWKYNDLKPRAYYCIGGSNYWKSRYMKSIAIAFMDSVPCTHVRRRTHPDGLQNYMDEEDTVMLWDLTSFTTSLAELKFFLYFVARYLEEDLYIRQHPLRIFDYATGLHEVNVWDLIDDYNEEVNVFSEYSLHRLIDTLGLLDSDYVLLCQQNSGMLGVPGNIGFSTCFHGLHSSAAQKNRDAGIGVGDDQMILVGPQITTDQVKLHISTVGNVHPMKFGIFGPGHYEDIGWKFLKRPFRRRPDGTLYFGYMFDFPILAYVFDVRSPNRKFPDTRDPVLRMERFVVQVAKFLWDILYQSHLVDDDDIDLLSRVLYRCYKHYDLPVHGALPGSHRHSSGHKISLAIPPIVFACYDPRREDWSEYLWENNLCRIFRIPVAGYVKSPEFSHVGQVYRSCLDKYALCLIDLEVLEDRGIEYEEIEALEENKRRFMETLHGVNPMHRLKFVKEPPVYHESILDALYEREQSYLPGLGDEPYWGVY